MAVRNDFTAGEVLAAADLNDTFAEKADYPSGGSNGDLLTKSGTSTAWAAPSVAGLTLITAETLAAVSSVTINTCFTSTYDNYVMYFSLTGSTNNNVLLQMRNAGSTITAANYQWWQVGHTNAGNNGNAASLGQTSWRIAQADSSVPGVGFVNFYQPLTSRAHVLNGGASGFTGTDTSTQFTGFRYSASQAFDSIVVTASSGNISGSLRIYGLQKS
jgi:hypothetical protein